MAFFLQMGGVENTFSDNTKSKHDLFWLVLMAKGVNRVSIENQLEPGPVAFFSSLFYYPLAFNNFMSAWHTLANFRAECF